MKSADNTGQLLVSQEYNMVASEIQDRILTIRGTQVLFDRDLAELYGVSTKALNQAVKRNIRRFPDSFMFQLTKDDFANLRLQNVTSKHATDSGDSVLRSQNVTSKRGGLRYCPYAFTEHGIVMLASLLKTEIAVAMSVRIVNAFVTMRKFLLANAQVFSRLEKVEQRQLTTDEKVNEILNRLNMEAPPPQGVFYDGQLWDACSLVEKLIGRARVSLLLIDNWIGPGTLDLLAKKAPGVSAVVVTSSRGNQLAPSDIEKFNAQYPPLDVRTSLAFHDRFLIIDDKELYLIGASLKDLGKKCFGFTKMDPQEIPHLKGKAFNVTT